MKIPMPCEFGDTAMCNGKMRPLKGVSWFKWSGGMEYTYFFSVNDKWHMSDFYTTFESTQPFEFTIPDRLLTDDFIKEKGYPLKGRGYVNGIYYADGKTYVDFIMTDRYLSHVKVQCDSKGEYLQNGNIIFPTSWDTEEKKERALLKSVKFITGEPLVIKAPEPKQMNIFEFIN